LVMELRHKTFIVLNLGLKNACRTHIFFYKLSE
jgi:hypothetical protein